MTPPLSDDSNPIGVGGVGGSGTRVVAAILSELGYYIGGDLNDAHDNLWFTLLFKYREVSELNDGMFERFYRVFRRAMTGLGDEPGLAREETEFLLAAERRSQHDRSWLGLRLHSLHEALTAPNPRMGSWAWKEPNTHLVLDRLLAAEPRLKFVQVVRNGLDMAFSGNQNQLSMWAPLLLGHEASYTPEASFKYWCAVHRRLFRIAEAFPQRVMLLNFDRLCREPAAQLDKLLDFLGLGIPWTERDGLERLIDPPRTIDRHLLGSIATPEADDTALMRRLGFDIPAP